MILKNLILKQNPYSPIIILFGDYIHQIICFSVNTITNHYTHLKYNIEIHHKVGKLSTQKEV